MIKLNNRYGSQPQRSVVAGAKTNKRLTDSEFYQEKDSQRLEALASKQGLMSTSDATPRMSQLPLNIDTDPLMEGMDYELQDKILFNMYRDMYWHDPV